MSLVPVAYAVFLFIITLYSFISYNILLSVAFFGFGFGVAATNFWMLYGGIVFYFKDPWNYLDIIRNTFLILVLDAQVNNHEYYSTFLLVFSILAWARGISYFRAVSYTRYMIRLILEVIKDIFPFLVIVIYSTIAAAVIFQLIQTDNSSFFDNLTNSYLITISVINPPTYNYTQ